MKAFRFRLAQALRWRDQSVLVEEARLAAAAARVAAVKAAQKDREQRCAAAARELVEADPGVAIRSYDGFLKASGRQARILAQEEKAASAEYGEAMTRLVEASRKARLLEKLCESDLRTWQSGSDRELADFVAEAFLMRQSALRRSESRRSGDALNITVVDGTIRRQTGA